MLFFSQVSMKAFTFENVCVALCDLDFNVADAKNIWEHFCWNVTIYCSHTAPVIFQYKQVEWLTTQHIRENLAYFFIIIFHPSGIARYLVIIALPAGLLSDSAQLYEDSHVNFCCLAYYWKGRFIDV